MAATAALLGKGLEELAQAAMMLGVPDPASQGAEGADWPNLENAGTVLRAWAGLVLGNLPQQPAGRLIVVERKLWGTDVVGRIAAGTVSVNDAYAPTYGSIDAPMGGMKESGIGRRHGVEGILKFTEPQTVAVQRVAPIAAPPGMARDRYARLLTGALRVLDRIPGMR